MHILNINESPPELISIEINGLATVLQLKEKIEVLLGRQYNKLKQKLIYAGNAVHRYKVPTYIINLIIIILNEKSTNSKIRVEHASDMRQSDNFFREILSRSIFRFSRKKIN